MARPNTFILSECHEMGTETVTVVLFSSEMVAMAVPRCGAGVGAGAEQRR